MKKSGKSVMTQELILKAIDTAVQATGYPVTGQVLKFVDVDRTEARRLERKGLLKSVPLAIGGQYVIGYYVVGGIYPEKLSHAEVQKALKIEAKKAAEQEEIPSEA
jgi:hypothetical protein